MTLLTHGGQIAANVTERGRSVLTAEGSHDILLHFGHAQVALGLVVGKRD